MAASSESPTIAVAARLRWLAPVAIIAGFLWIFPLFHIVSLSASAPAGATGGATFDAVASAARVWEKEIIPVAARAEELRTFAAELRRDPAVAAKRHAHEVGLGGASYFFVRGRGRVIARSDDEVKLALDGTEGVVVSLAIGALFGNTVRDGCGVLNLNSYPGLEEFNALSAELNALVESRVLPALREGAVVGATVTFAGCAAAPDSPNADPLLSIVPVSAVVKK